MAFEPKVNTGSVFPNERKDADSHPDRTGQGLIECPHCGKSWSTWINGWLKKSKDGKPYLSLSFKQKEDRPQRGGGNQGGGGYQQREERGSPQRGAGPKYGDWRDKQGGGGPDEIPF